MARAQIELQRLGAVVLVDAVGVAGAPTMSRLATRLTWPWLSSVPASVPMMEPPWALTVMVMPLAAWMSPRRMLPLGESRPTVVSL